MDDTQEQTTTDGEGEDQVTALAGLDPAEAPAAAERLAAELAAELEAVGTAPTDSVPVQPDPGDHTNS